MNRNFLRYIPYAGLAASLVGIVLSVRKPKKMLICSPMMDDGLAAPIMDYAKKHPAYFFDFLSEPLKLTSSINFFGDIRDFMADQILDRILVNTVLKSPRSLAARY